MSIYASLLRITARRLVLVICLAAGFACFSGLAAAAAVADSDKAQTVVHMLDYVGVDYPNFVKDGKVLNAQEYSEQQEFASQAITLLAQLPAVAEQQALLTQARELQASIEAKASGAEVAGGAARLRAGIIAAWKLTVAPRSAPDVAQGARLFAQTCAACHGAEGRADGPAAKGMDPVPANFHDEARMRQRSPYGLFNSITLGVGGTPMRAFSEYTEADRWALAFFVAGLRETPQTLARGEAAWKQGENKAAFDSLRSLATKAPVEQGDAGTASDAERAYLTRHPEALQAVAPVPLEFARARVNDAVQAYAGGDREGARQLAIAAYLEGFEMIESSLDNVDAALRAEGEREMMGLRTVIGEGRPPAEVAAQADKAKAVLDRAAQALAGEGLSPTTAFLSSLIILLREGLEAILVLSAIIAFVVKTGRRDALPYIHAGWIGAMVLGAVTWAVARYLIAISGASRELTEGYSALFAAVMLLYVGWWLHSRSNAQAWNSFIREQVNSALGKSTLWAMAGISFLAVYRELFEVILFYETLWTQAGPQGQGAVLGGIAAAAALLVLIGGAILRYSVRLPLSLFFTATSALLAFMAVVFTGNGAAALQEAGVLGATGVNFVSLPLLGVHPTMQGLSLQAMALAVIAAALWLHRTKKA